MSRQPILSVIIPTHNRSGLLMRSLEALSGQTCSPEIFEVIVMADACQDDTADRVATYAVQAPYRLTLLQHNARSAAATRNLGAANARGETLLFIDDDIIAQPELVQRHLESQAPDSVVLGYSKPALPPLAGWWQYHTRQWWEDRFRAMRQPGHRFTYKDFFSGNVSMPVALFQKTDGFDTSFADAGYEDYEFGLRLLKAGVHFRFDSEAVGYHRDDADFHRWLRRTRKEGTGAIRIGQRHPEIRSSLYLATRATNVRRRRMRHLAFNHPHIGDRLEQLLIRQTGLYERLRLRRQWWELIRSLREYNYWRGVAAVLKQHELKTWLQEAATLSPAITADAPVVDMANLPPRPVLQNILRQATDVGLRLTMNGVEVLTIPPQPGAEPLQEAHLHQALAEMARSQFVPAMALPFIRAIIERGSLC